MSRTHRAVAAASTFLGALFVACGGDGASAGPTITERDSAGVVIVENGPVTDALPFATVEALPTVDIGEISGSPEYQLFRVVAARRLADGRIIVANSGSYELRFYDPDGGYLHAVGAEGEGPGEFTRLSGMWVRRDSIFAFDSQNRAFSVFDTDGAFARSYSVGGDSQFGFPNDLFSDAGSLVQIRRVFRSGEETSGIDRANIALTVYDRDGRLERELGEWPGSEAFVVAEADFMMVRSLTFGRSLYAAVSDDRIVVGNSDSLAFDILGRDGTTARRVRVSQPMRPVDEGAYERVKAEEMAGMDDVPAEVRASSERMFDDMPRHDTYPAFRMIRVDDGHRIWLEDFRAPGDDTRWWTVFSPDGHALGRVRTPDRFTVFDIGTDYVLGVITDEFDVEHLRLHALTPAASALETETSG